MPAEGPPLQTNLAKLHEAVEKRDVPLFQSVFYSVTGTAPKKKAGQLNRAGKEEKEVFLPTVNPRDVDPDLLIKTIESAIKLSQWDTAKTVLGLFDSTNSPANQFQCRSLMCRAMLEFNDRHGFKGQALVDQVFVSISFLLKALEIALSQPRYSFLIHNLWTYWD